MPSVCREGVLLKEFARDSVLMNISTYNLGPLVRLPEP